jgi:hypothetical protein
VQAVNGVRDFSLEASVQADTIGTSQSWVLKM